MEVLEQLLSIRRRVHMFCRRWRLGLRHVHPSAYIAKDCFLAPDLRMADYSFLNFGCYIDYNVEIGRYVLLGPRVAIVGGDHIVDRPGVPIIFSGRPAQPRTIIEDDVWIGYGAIVKAGVRIGRGAIVGAGSVVTKDIPAYEIHAGIPNRKLGSRFASESDIHAHEAMLNGPTVAGTSCGRKKRRSD